MLSAVYDTLFGGVLMPLFVELFWVCVVIVNHSSTSGIEQNLLTFSN
jgi:hypothetical protein